MSCRVLLLLITVTLRRRGRWRVSISASSKTRVAAAANYHRGDFLSPSVLSRASEDRVLYVVRALPACTRRRKKPTQAGKPQKLSSVPHSSGLLQTWRWVKNALHRRLKSSGPASCQVTACNFRSLPLPLALDPLPPTAQSKFFIFHCDK